MSEPIDRALEIVRQRIAGAVTPKAKLRLLWAAAVQAQGLAPAEIVLAKFSQLADDIGLTRSLGWSGSIDLAHVLGWAARGMCPFEGGRHERH